MKQIAKLLVLIVLAGCAVTEGDPLVVNAERTVRASFEVFDTFLKLEYDNRSYLAKWPKIRQAADFIGDHGPKALTNATHYIQVYKASRDPVDRINLTDSVNALEPMTRLANENMAQSRSALATNTPTLKH